MDGPSMPSRETSGDGRLLTNGKPHSTDSSLGTIRCFDDPKKKIRLITSGSPWISKTHKFNAALKEIDPGWCWQIDADEFYHHETYTSLFAYLRAYPKLTDVEFFAYHFWGSPDYHCEVDRTEWGNQIPWRRLFRFTGNEYWERHEPPRMCRRTPNFLLTRESTQKLGFMLYHYGYVTVDQFRQREIYYRLPSGSLTGELKGYDYTGKCSHRLSRFMGTHPIDIGFLYETRTRNLHGDLHRTAVKHDQLPGDP